MDKPTLNIENVKIVRAGIAGLPEEAIFMPIYIHIDKKKETLAQAREPSCGTKACIAGWTVLFLGDPLWELKQSYFGEETQLYLPETTDTTELVQQDVQDVASKLLGLDSADSNYLFCGDWASCPLDGLTKADVLHQLDYMIETGQVVRDGDDDGDDEDYDDGYFDESDSDDE